MPDPVQQARQKREYEARKAAGLCTRCGQRVAKPGLASCPACIQERHREFVQDPRPAKTRRRCLRCDKAFLSDGAYHRLCEACRASGREVDQGLELRRLPRVLRLWRA
jgi:Zn finger protein HypA/HybF involved in hydrogenase expression